MSNSQLNLSPKLARSEEEKCMHLGCSNARAIICNSHTQNNMLCFQCAYVKHSECDKQDIPSLEKAESVIRVCLHLVRLLVDHGQTYSLDTMYAEYTKDVSDYIKQVDQFRAALKQAIEDWDYVRIGSIGNEVIALKQSLDRSQVLAVYKDNKASTELHYSLTGVMPEGKIDEIKIHQIITEQTKEMADSHQEKLTSAVNEEAERVESTIREEYKERLQELNQDIARLQAKLRQDKAVGNLFNDTQLELYKLLKPEGIMRFRDYKLSLSLKTDADKYTLAKLKSIQLPEIKSIFMQFVDHGSPSDINEFLSTSFPGSLPLFCFGWNANSQLRMDMFIDNLQECFPRVTKEILFNYFIFSKHDLEAVFKNSRNAKRLIIRHSKIEFEDALDFSISEPYYTEYLSFAFTGRTNALNSNWSAKPQILENIISAIAKCGLAKSLTTFNVHECGFEVDAVKEMLVKSGLDKINVIQEENSPSAD